MRRFPILAAIFMLFAAATPASAQQAPAQPTTPDASQPGNPPQRTIRRIVGGHYAPNGAAPWMVEIYLYGDIPQSVRDVDAQHATNHDGLSDHIADRKDWDVRHFCGGVAISPNWVLTAAHCVRDDDTPVDKAITYFKRTSRLRIGSLFIDGGSGSSCVPLDVVLAPAGDIALIRIDQATCAVLGQTAPLVPIRILETASNDKGRRTFNGATDMSVYGWGMTEARPEGAKGVETTRILALDDAAHIDHNSSRLKYATVSFVPTQECLRTPGYRKFVKQGMLCSGLASGKSDQCDGDSGGPLTQVIQIGDWTFEDLLVGLVHGGNGCAQVKTPGLYIYVPQYLPWIERTIGHRDNPAIGRAMLAKPAVVGSP